MDNILETYLIIVNTIALLSFICFVILISRKISQKNSFKVASWIFLIASIIGMYLFIPSKLFITGVLKQNIKYIETAIRFSITPIERKLYKETLGNIQNKYITPELSEKINKIKKTDLFLLEAQNTYNLEIRKYKNKIENLRISK